MVGWLDDEAFPELGVEFAYFSGAFRFNVSFRDISPSEMGLEEIFWLKSNLGSIDVTWKC